MRIFCKVRQATKGIPLKILACTGEAAIVFTRMSFVAALPMWHICLIIFELARPAR